MEGTLSISREYPTPFTEPVTIEDANDKLAQLNSQHEAGKVAIAVYATHVLLLAAWKSDHTVMEPEAGIDLADDNMQHVKNTLAELSQRQSQSPDEAAKLSEWRNPSKNGRRFQNVQELLSGIDNIRTSKLLSLPGITAPIEELCQLNTDGRGQDITMGGGQIARMQVLSGIMNRVKVNDNLRALIQLVQLENETTKPYRAQALALSDPKTVIMAMEGRSQELWEKKTRSMIEAATIADRVFEEIVAVAEAAIGRMDEAEEAVRLIEGFVKNAPITSTGELDARRKAIDALNNRDVVRARGFLEDYYKINPQTVPVFAFQIPRFSGYSFSQT